MIVCINKCPKEKHEGCCVGCADKDVCEDRCITEPTYCEDAKINEESRDEAVEILKLDQLELIKLIGDIKTHEEEVKNKRIELKDRVKKFYKKWRIINIEDKLFKLTYDGEKVIATVKVDELCNSYKRVCSKFNGCPHSITEEVELKKEEIE